MLRSSTAVLLLVCVLPLCWWTTWSLALRRRLARDHAAFRCLVRVDGGSVQGLPTRHRGTPCWGHWVHDVLLLHEGTWLPRVHALPVHSTLDTLEPAAPADRVRRRQDAVVLVLCLDDGGQVRVTAATQASEQLAGPFLALALRRAPTRIPGQRSD
jgi:hypothetical protein